MGDAPGPLPLAETFENFGPRYPTVEITESDVALSSKKWETSIVGQFSNLDQPALPFSDLKAHLLDGSWHGDGPDRRFTRPIWSFVRSKVDVFSLGGSLYVFPFSDGSDLYNVMIGAPYDVAGRLLLLQRWKRGIDPLTHRVAVAPLWLYMIRLPIEFWNEECMGKAAGPVGAIVRAHPHVAFPQEEELGVAPRVLVEVEFGKELVMGTNVPLQDGRAHFVVFGYEHKARVCVRCGGVRVGIRYPLCPAVDDDPCVIVPPVPAAAGPVGHPLGDAQQQQQEEGDGDEGECCFSAV